MYSPEVSVSSTMDDAIAHQSEITSWKWSVANIEIMKYVLLYMRTVIEACQLLNASCIELLIKP